MSWEQQLLDVYSTSESIAGIPYEEGGVLLPIAHSWMKSHIEVRINDKGEFKGTAAQVETEIIVPSTESAESRSSSKSAPYPLMDRLKYLAGDYLKYVDTSKAEKVKNFHKDYMAALKKWVESSFSHPQIEAIYIYLKQGTLIKDLIADGTLYLDENQKILDTWSGDRREAPQVFKYAQVKPSETTVRFVVYSQYKSGNLTKELPEVWLNKNVRKKYQDFLAAQHDKARDKFDLCYVTGTESYPRQMQPKKIIKFCPNAKLISANDDTGFTYRGRFENSQQAASISYEASQKIHSALRWLSDDRGYSFGDQTVIVWASGNKDVPEPFIGSDEVLERKNSEKGDNTGFTVDGEKAGGRGLRDNSNLFMKNEMEKQSDIYGATDRPYSDRVRHALYGRFEDLSKHNDMVSVMVLSSATPGRLSIVQYWELLAGEYLASIANWFESCAWFRPYIKGAGVVGEDAIGIDSLKAIVGAVYGKNANEKICRRAFNRLLACILTGKALPEDIVAAIVKRVSTAAVNRSSKTPSSNVMDYLEWERSLSTACALYRKSSMNRKGSSNEKGYKIMLESDRDDRDYLYGRLLAVADWVERGVHIANSEERQTNAMKYKLRFSQRPFETWKKISEKLEPYWQRVPAGGFTLKELIDQITNSFRPKEFEDNSALSGAYLLGFSAQKQDFRKRVQENKKSPTGDNDSTDENENGEEQQ
jgi:CRISPR-associated protein Csd1